MDELSVLVLYGLLTAILLGLTATGQISQLGMGYMLSARDEPQSPRGMLARAERSVANSVTALVLVAVPILVIALRETGDEWTRLAALCFLIARVAYVPGRAFFADGGGTRQMRLNFSYADSDQIVEGIRRLGKLIGDELSLLHAFGR